MISLAKTFEPTTTGSSAIRYRTLHGLPVTVTGGQLVMPAGPAVGAVIMPVTLGTAVLDRLTGQGLHPPVIAHRQISWFFLTANSIQPALTPEQKSTLFCECVTTVPPGTGLILPTPPRPGQPQRRREWISEPNGSTRPSLEAVLNTALTAITTLTGQPQVPLVREIPSAATLSRERAAPSPRPQMTGLAAAPPAYTMSGSGHRHPS